MRDICVIDPVANTVTLKIKLADIVKLSYDTNPAPALLGTDDTFPMFRIALKNRIVVCIPNAINFASMYYLVRIEMKY